MMFTVRTKAGCYFAGWRTPYPNPHLEFQPRDATLLVDMLDAMAVARAIARLYGTKMVIETVADADVAGNWAGG